MDDLRIDSHKLIFHLDRVEQWKKRQVVAPIYVEVSPSGSCNHRCIFCAVDYLKYQTVFLDTKILTKRVKEMAKLGVRSIMYAGEGEPLIHKDIASIVTSTKLAGIDVAITTNGVLLTKELSEAILPSLSWIRFSFNGGTAENYAKVHRCRPADFERVLGNMADAVEIKRRLGLATTIGVQMLLLPENISEVVPLAKRLRRIGVDYFSIKPYSQHPKSGASIDANFHYDKLFSVGEDLSKLETDDFTILFRKHTMLKLGTKRSYDHCLALPFWSYIDANGNLFACSVYLWNERFNCGNIHDESMRAIFFGEKRRAIIEHCASELDTATCRENCRMDEVNRYLWELTHPGEHVNFI